MVFFFFFFKQMVAVKYTHVFRVLTSTSPFTGLCVSWRRTQLEEEKKKKKTYVDKLQHWTLKLFILKPALHSDQYSLGLHKLLTLEVLVSLVSSTNASAVDAPALLRVVALLGLEFAVVLAVGVVDAIVVHEGLLHRLSSQRPGSQVVFSSVHLSLHQEALRDHWGRNKKKKKGTSWGENRTTCGGKAAGSRSTSRLDRRAHLILTFVAVQRLMHFALERNFALTWGSITGRPLHSFTA